MSSHEIRALADLARLELSDEDVSNYQKDFEGILGYISAINSVQVDSYDDHVRGDTVNRMRDDEEAYESGIFTEDLLNATPHREGQYVRVDKIL